MEAIVPIQAIVDVRDDADAQAAAKKIAAMLQNPMVKALMAGQGVRLKSTSVGSPQKRGA